MSSKLQCFISYCHDDNDQESVNSIKKYLQEFSNNKINFLLDEETSFGGDLVEYMEELDKVDGIIILLTPAYKKKVEERIKSGVLNEFRIILDRLDKLREYRKGNLKDLEFSPFIFVPIIFSRDFSNSCPNELKRYKCLDFSDFQIKHDGKIISLLENKYSKFFNQICSEINTVKSLSKSSVAKVYQETLKILFHETKHDNILNTPFGKIEDLYVKTNAYYDVQIQKTYFFLGRKGSGKSTLGPLTYMLNIDKYKDHIDINIDSLNLEYLLNITLNKSISKDLGILMQFSDFFKICWEIFIYIQCLHVIVKEYDEKRLDADQNKFAPTIKEWIKNFSTKYQNTSYIYATKHDIIDVNSLFQWSVSEAISHMESAIKKSRETDSNFHFDLNNYIQKEKVITTVIPKKVFDSFHSIVKICKRLFLISFDGFDSMYEQFRIESLKYEIDDEIRGIRTKLERGFLEGFLNLINEVKSNKYNINFYSNIHVCVTVPKDRFLEIKDSQRDSYRYISKFQEIKWSGIELGILLRKRLELLKNYKTNTDYNAVDRLNQVLDFAFENMPKKTVINLGDKQFEKEIFLNVLRHSFWRPREIIIYYARIISIIDDFKKRQLEPDSYTISKVISETTFDIIQNEFLTEFQNYCKNLNEIIYKFKDSKQIISYNAIKSILGPVHFEFIDNITPQKDLLIKIDFLFEVGFLGIEVNSKGVDRYKFITDDIFCFNENNKSYKILKSNDFENCNFVIHPIFFEYLGLNHQNQNRLSLNIDWEYLKKQDIFIKS